MKSGFTVVEALFAAALFLIVVAGGAVVLTQGWDSNRLGGEQTQATQYAAEGLENMRSLRNQAFSNLVDGTTTATFDKYTRNIVVSTVDADTKQVVSTVTWTVGGSRNNSVILTTYLTNWRASITTPTPTPTVSTCSDLCVLSSYLSGTCRSNANQCTSNSETNLVAGDILCTGGNNHTCCCTGPTPTPTIGPTPITCADYCIANAFTGGSCLGNVPPCNNSGATNLAAGNIYCSGGGPSADTCCCTGPTPTPTTGPTSTPTPTPITCASYCIANSFTGGTCRASIAKCTQNGETNLAGGDVYCTGGNNSDTCCCIP